MRPARTAADRRAAVARHALPACDACGVVLEASLHEGRIVGVYRGRSVETGRPVAVKVTRAEWRGHPGALELIEREHRILSSIDHPRVVTPLGFAKQAGIAALVLEDLAGGDLVPLAGVAPRHWAAAALDVSAALTAVAASGYVHADVKARNVLLDQVGRAKLIDFGSALPIGRPLPSGGRTRAHEPLRFELERADPVLDVYAFAVLVHELLTGRLPFGQGPDARAPRVDRAPTALPGARAQRLGDRSRGVHSALAALSDRLRSTLSAAEPSEVGTLIDFADVLESVQMEAAGAVFG